MAFRDGSRPHNVVAVLLWAAPLGVLGFGCNQILGIEQAQLDTATGGSASGGGGSDGTGGDASGGAPGGSGGSNSCGGELSLGSELVRGCVLRFSCDPILPYYTMSDCVSYAYQLTNAQEQCTYQARNCEDIEYCLGRHMVDPVSCEHASGWSCYGGNAVLCGDYSYSISCTLAGESCYSPAGFPTQGGTAPCLADTNPCYDPPGEYHCDGSILYECIEGLRYGRDCAVGGSTCVEKTPGLATCIDSVTSCSDIGAFGCDGNVLTYCGPFGLSSLLDCGVAGLSCVATDTYADCVAPGCTLQDVGDCTESCDGTELKYCVGGAQASLDCVDFGFTTCEVTTNAGLPMAFCSGRATPGKNSCAWARDGECDEPTLCAPGTDTSDCG